MNQKEKEFLDFCYQNDVKKVKELLESGIDVNLRNEKGETGLHIASWDGYNEVVKFLIDSGIDVNIQNIDGQTPLHGASLCGNTETVKLLLEAGADFHIKNKSGKTPLDYAKIDIDKKMDVVRLLEEAEAKK